jgi:dynein heavy chain 1
MGKIAAYPPTTKFRNLAMTKPNRQLIAQVMLYSQGFRTAEKLASKIVPFFQ